MKGFNADWALINCDIMSLPYESGNSKPREYKHIISSSIC